MNLWNKIKNYLGKTEYYNRIHEELENELTQLGVFEYSVGTNKKIYWDNYEIQVCIQPKNCIIIGKRGNFYLSGVYFHNTKSAANYIKVSMQLEKERKCNDRFYHLITEMHRLLKCKKEPLSIKINYCPAEIYSPLSSSANLAFAPCYMVYHEKLSPIRVTQTDVEVLVSPGKFEGDFECTEEAIEVAKQSWKENN